MKRTDYIDKIFEPHTSQKIQVKLPYLFQIANVESSRAGKVGMEVGVLREKILVALFLYVYGEENVNTSIPATEAETDVIVCESPISIKTKQGTANTGIKLAWTVDSERADLFLEHYKPKTDLLVVKINWNSEGGLYFIPKEVQEQIIRQIGIESYIKLPKTGTNNRGIEFSSKAISSLLEHRETKSIAINWLEKDIIVNTFERWVELWKE